MDYLRVLRILIVFSFCAFFYIFMGLKLIMRHNYNVTRYLFFFYIFQTALFIINLVYAFIYDDFIVHFLYLILVYVGSLGLAFILLFNVMLLKTEKFFNFTKQLVFILVYAIILIGIFLIPNGVTINKSTDWKPVYNLEFSLFLITVNSTLSIAPSLVYSIKIYARFTDVRLKKKFFYYIIGLYIYIFVLYATVVFNYLNDPNFSIIYFIIGISAIPSAYLMYIGTNNLYKANNKEIISKKEEVELCGHHLVQSQRP